MNKQKVVVGYRFLYLNTIYNKFIQIDMKIFYTTYFFY